MDIDLSLSDPLFSYPPQTSQAVVTQCLPDATSTAVVDYADTLGNPQTVRKTTEPSYNLGVTGPLFQTPSRDSRHPASMTHPVGQRSPQEHPMIDPHVSTTNIVSRRRRRPTKPERDLIKQQRREATDGRRAARIEEREDWSTQNHNGKQVASGAFLSESSVQECFNRLTVNENNDPGNYFTGRDPSNISRDGGTTTIPFRAEEPIVEFGFKGRSDITASSSPMNGSGTRHPNFPNHSADSASWASLKAQALQTGSRPGKSFDPRKYGKNKRGPEDFVRRLAELEKQLTTLRYSDQGTTKSERKIAHMTRQALSLRVRIEEGEGRLTAPEAKELRKANARMHSRKTKKTDHEEGVEDLVDQVALLL
ncbi:hypothetical protein MMC34_004925 [Xylographa carneopallida]|nr:hypothetical protein [Xylographa carneopallida]